MEPRIRNRPLNLLSVLPLCFGIVILVINNNIKICTSAKILNPNTMYFSVPNGTLGLSLDSPDNNNKLKLEVFPLDRTTAATTTRTTTKILIGTQDTIDERFNEISAHLSKNDVTLDKLKILFWQLFGLAGVLFSAAFIFRLICKKRTQNSEGHVYSPTVVSPHRAIGRSESANPGFKVLEKTPILLIPTDSGKPPPYQEISPYSVSFPTVPKAGFYSSEYQPLPQQSYQYAKSESYHGQISRSPMPMKCALYRTSSAGSAGFAF